MKKLFVLAVALLFVLAGCSSDNANNTNRADKANGSNHSSQPLQPWNYKDGFVISKQDGEVLVVRNEVSDINAPLNQLLEKAKPDAISLSVDEESYAAVALGDHVSIYIGNGMIDQSYPAQASAQLHVKGQGFIGYVVKLENDRILVVSPKAQDFSATGGQKNYYEAIWFSKIPSNIDVGMKVEVWAEGELLESYPAQGTAKHVVTIQETQPEGATLHEYEAVKEAILSLSSDNEPNFIVVIDAKYEAASSEWIVSILNEQHDQVKEISVPDTH